VQLFGKFIFLESSAEGKNKTAETNTLTNGTKKSKLMVGYLVNNMAVHRVAEHNYTSSTVHARYS
jgi:hypothetical protein